MGNYSPPFWGGVGGEAATTSSLQHRGQRRFRCSSQP